MKKANKYSLHAWFKYSLQQEAFMAVIPGENTVVKISKPTLAFLSSFLEKPKSEDALSAKEREILDFCLAQKILRADGSPHSDLPRAVKKNKLDYLDVRVTSKCNLKCIYCSYSNFAEPANRDRHMSMETFRKLVSDALEFGVTTLHFSGGEPLLNKDLEEMIILARKYFRVSMVFNGTLLDRATARMFKRNKLGISISLDSVDDKINEKNRTCGAGKVMQSIDLLLEEGISPDVVCTVTRNNYDHVMDLIRHFSGKPVRIGVSNLNHTGRAAELEEELVITEEQHHALSEKVKEFLEKEKTTSNVVLVDNEKLSVVDYKYKPIIEQLERSRETYRASSLLKGKAAIFNCQAGNFSLSIAPNGDISPCSMCKDFVLGNIGKTALKDLWETSEDLKFFNYIRKIPTSALEFCNKCEYKEVCNGGCRANAYSVTGSFLAPNPACVLVRKSGRYSRIKGCRPGKMAVVEFQPDCD